MSEPVKTFMIGLTNADILHLQNGGRITLNPKAVGWVDMDIVVFYGATEQEALKRLVLDPEYIAKVVDSHLDDKN
jgi:hypothetical protein